MIKKIIKSLVNIFYFFKRKKEVRNLKKEMRKKVIKNRIPDLTKDEKKLIKNNWRKYHWKPDLYSYRWLFHVSGIRDWRFISEDLYVDRIMPNLYDYKKAIALDDKNLYDLYFSDVNMPRTIIHNISGTFLDSKYNVISRAEAIEIIKKEKKQIVVKPAINTCRGEKVVLISPEKIDEAFDNYTRDFIVQEKIEQCDLFSSLSDSSNVIRVTTFIHDGNVYPLQPTIRVGDSGIFTDQGGKRGFCIGINNDGSLKEFGLATKVSPIQESTTPNGFVFGGKVIPNFKSIIDVVKKLHPRFSEFPLIGWDIIVDKEGSIVLLECNFHWTGIFKYQECNGPLFEELTEAVLNKYLVK